MYQPKLCQSNLSLAVIDELPLSDKMVPPQSQMAPILDMTIIYRVLHSRVQCLAAGFPLDHPIITTLDELRDQYIQQVGVATYFRQMVQIRNERRTSLATVSSKLQALAPSEQSPLDHYEKQINFDFTSIDTIQRLFKIRAYSLKQGLQTNQIILNAFCAARARHIASVGAPQYLTAMLGPIAKVSALHCTFYAVGHQLNPIELHGDLEQPVAKFLIRYFRRRSPYLKVQLTTAKQMLTRHL